jgi:hypothetical protein
MTLSSHFPTTTFVALLIYYADWKILDIATLIIWSNIKIAEVGVIDRRCADPPLGPDLDIYTQPKGYRENQTVSIPNITPFMISHDSLELSRMICNLDLPLLGPT